MASREETLHRHLADAIAAEEGFERQLRAFAKEGDDDQVRALFLTHAEQTSSQRQRLATRLEQLGGSVSGLASVAAVFSLAPKNVQVPHVPEELTVRNLMAAYTVEAAECGMYEALIAVARAAGDSETTELARAIQREAHAAADSFWSSIPSRSLIAYNMLTVSEIDPAVQTKVNEATWT